MSKSNEISCETHQQNLSTNNEQDKWDSLFQDISETNTDINTNNIEKLYMTPNIDLEIKLELSSDERVKYTICKTCNVEGVMGEGVVECPSCGLVTYVVDDNNKFSYSVEKDHNVSVNSFMSFNIVGKNSYCYQRSFLKTCANYSYFRKNSNKKDLCNYNYQHEGKKIPKNAVKLAIEMFSTIKEHNYVFRGNGKKGVLGACLFYACVIKHITKTPREIASVMKIEERFLSHGDRIVQEMNEKGIINIPTILRPIKDYLDQYFPALKLPDKYKQFILDLIDRAEIKNIHVIHDSRTTTKCIGAIYTLSLSLKSLRHITKDVIVAECNISKSTFIRYHNLLMSHYKVLKPVFKKHKIPMQSSWRSIVVSTD